MGYTCKKCGSEMIFENVQLSQDSNGKPLYGRFIKCPKCQTSSRFDDSLFYVAPAKSKKDSPLSIVAAILGLFGCLSIVGLVCAIIDLAMNKKEYRHLGSWVALVFFLLWIVFGGAIFTIGGFSDTKEPATPTAIAIDSEEPAPVIASEPQESVVSEQPTEQQATETQEESKGIEVGNQITIDGIKMSYTDCGTVTSFENSYEKPEDGNIIVYATFEFENVDDYDVCIASMDCYIDGYKLDDFTLFDDSIYLSTVSPGRKLSGNMYYEVPKDTKLIELEYGSVWESEKTVFIVDKEHNEISK